MIFASYEVTEIAAMSSLLSQTPKTRKEEPFFKCKRKNNE